MKPSPAQIRALRWLARQGRASLDRYGNALGPGGDKSAAAPVTWARLLISGHAAPHPMAGHFGITAKGLAALKGRR